MPPAVRSWTRRFLIVCAILLAVVVVVLGLLQLSPVATWAVGRLGRLIPLNPGYSLEVGRVSGDWVTGLQLEDVRLQYRTRVLAVIERLKVSYDLRRLRGAETRIRELTVDGAQLVARREQGEWDLANALRRSEDTVGAGVFTVDRIELKNVQLEAALTPDSVIRAREVLLRGRDLVLSDEPLLTLDTLHARFAPPVPTPLWIDLAARGAATGEELRLDPLRIRTDRSEIGGRVVLPRNFADRRLMDRLAVELKAVPLALADVAAILPAVRPEGEVRLKARASGEQGVASGEVAAQLGDATVTLNGSTLVGSDAPVGYRAYGELRDVDPARVYLSAPPGRINADIEAGLDGPTLSRANGGVNLKLAKSQIAGTEVKDLDLRMEFHEGRGEISLRGEVAAMNVTATGWARPFDSLPSFYLTGAGRGTSQTDSLTNRLAGTPGDAVLEARFRVGGEGGVLRSARLNGRVDVAALRSNGERVPLGHAPIALTQGRLEARPEVHIAGGRITALATAHLGDTITYEIRRGSIDRVDIGQLLGDTLVAPLSGKFSLSGRALSPPEVVATARLELDDLLYGGRRVEDVVAAARLDRGRARLEVRGALQGGRLFIDADAQPFDSTREFTVRRASLERVDLGTLLGRPDLAGPVTIRARATGRWGEEMRTLRGRVDIEPSRLGRIEVSGGTFTTHLAGGRLVYEGTVHTRGGALEVSGDARPLDSIPSFVLRGARIDSLDLGPLLGRDSLQTKLSATLSGQSRGRTLGDVIARFEFELLPSRVNQAELGPGKVTLDLDRGAVKSVAHIDAAGGGLRAELTGRATGTHPTMHAQGELHLERLADWTGRSDADGHLTATFALEGTADSAGLLAVGGNVDASGSVGEARLDSLHVSLLPDTGRVVVDTIMVRSNFAVLDGAGRLAVREGSDTSALRVAGRVSNAEPLLALFGVDSVLLDSARLAVTVMGPAHHWRVEGDAEAYRLFYAGKQIEQMTLRGGGTLDGTHFTALAGDLKLQGGAFGRITLRELELAGRYDSVVAIQVAATLREDVHLTAALKGVARADTVRGTLDRLELVEGGRTWALERPTDVVLRPRVEVGDLALRAAADRSVAVQGIFDRRDTSDISLRFEGLELDALREVGLAPIGGRVDGALRLAGPAQAPTLEGKIAVTVRPKQGQDAGRIEASVNWTAQGLRLDAIASHQTGGRLTANGTLPWRLTLAPADTSAQVGVARGERSELDFKLQADSFELSLFEALLPPETVRELHGALTLKASLGGSFDAPQADGTLSLRGFTATVPVVGVTYEEGELAGRLSSNEIRVERLRLVAGNGEFTGSGTVRLDSLSNPAFDLTADLRGFRIARSDLVHSSATGQARLQGTMSEPFLSGKFRLGRTDIFIGVEGVPAQVKKVELTDEDRQMLGRTFGPAVLARARKKEGALLDRFKLDLDLDLPRRIWVHRRTSPQMDIELSGRLQVRQDPGQPMQFFGEVQPMPGRGYLLLYGRSFRLTGGEIELAGPADSTRFDVTAEYEVPTQSGPDAEGVLISVNAKGRPDSLQLDFSATPNMPQDDIISYIVTGRPASDSPLLSEEGRDLGRQLAFDRLSESFSGAAGEGLGLDVFQIRQDGLQGLTLTAGRYLARKLFVSLQQPIQVSSGTQATGQSLSTGFETEYSMRRWLRLNYRGGNVPSRVFLRWRRAY